MPASVYTVLCAGGMSATGNLDWTCDAGQDTLRTRGRALSQVDRLLAAMARRVGKSFRNGSQFQNDSNGRKARR